MVVIGVSVSAGGLVSDGDGTGVFAGGGAGSGVGSRRARVGAAVGRGGRVGDYVVGAQDGPARGR
ncbi:hypothetical protein, partial [Mycobacterium avium]|uniref:hypothetical protein n=1 Tax=Mycobacterium avium TaxID=1764 RepID=UPI00373FD5E1